MVTPESDDERILPEHPEWVGWACILAGPLCFILFGSLFRPHPGHILLRLCFLAW